MRHAALVLILALTACADPRASIFPTLVDDRAVARALAEAQCVPYERVPDPAARHLYLIRISPGLLYVCRHPERVRLWPQRVTRVAW